MPTEYKELACRGIRDEADTLRPLPMCQQCHRWQIADKAQEFIAPRPITAFDGQHIPTRIECSRRVAA